MQICPRMMLGFPILILVLMLSFCGEIAFNNAMSGGKLFDLDEIMERRNKYVPDMLPGPGEEHVIEDIMKNWKLFLNLEIPNQPRENLTSVCAEWHPFIPEFRIGCQAKHEWKSLRPKCDGTRFLVDFRSRIMFDDFLDYSIDLFMDFIAESMMWFPRIHRPFVTPCEVDERLDRLRDLHKGFSLFDKECKHSESLLERLSAQQGCRAPLNE